MSLLVLLVPRNCVSLTVRGRQARHHSLTGTESLDGKVSRAWMPCWDFQWTSPTERRPSLYTNGEQSGKPSQKYSVLCSSSFHLLVHPCCAAGCVCEIRPFHSTKLQLSKEEIPSRTSLRSLVCRTQLRFEPEDDASRNSQGCYALRWMLGCC